MSTDVLDHPTATPPAVSVTPRTRSASSLKVTQGRLIASEWIKLRSLRSTLWTLGGAVVLLVGLGVLISYIRTTQTVPDGPGADQDATGLSLSGVMLGQFAIGVLGVLVVTGEYATGMIRATLAAAPKRLPVLWAKVIVLPGVAFVVSLVSVLIAFFVSQAVLSGDGLQTTFGATGVARAVVGAALYLSVVGLLGVALGWLIRSTAGAVASLFGLLLVLPILFQLLPASWNDTVGPYLPGNAGQAVMTVTQSGTSLAPWVGFAVFCGYAAIALAAAAVQLKRRDA